MYLFAWYSHLSRWKCSVLFRFHVPNEPTQRQTKCQTFSHTEASKRLRRKTSLGCLAGVIKPQPVRIHFQPHQQKKKTKPKQSCKKREIHVYYILSTLAGAVHKLRWFLVENVWLKNTFQPRNRFTSIFISWISVRIEWKLVENFAGEEISWCLWLRALWCLPLLHSTARQRWIESEWGGSS